jgi:RNA polymerase sigma-70 factor (ECF subfamily)
MFVVSLLPCSRSSVFDTELDVPTVLACQRGDRQAVTQFVHCYERRVFAYLSRTLGRGFPIDDLAQEVFVRAFPALVRFDVSERPKLSTWLLSIAHRVAVDARRKSRGHVPLLELEHQPSPQPNPEQLVGREQLRAAVARAVEALPPEQRDVFVLSEFHELTTAEIAKAVGALEATVKTRLFRAKSRLRLALGSRFPVTP